MDKSGNMVAVVVGQRCKPLVFVEAEAKGLLCFDPLLHCFSVWAIPGDMPIVFSKEEVVLLPLPLFLVFVPISALAVVGPLGCV
jgi:hypothetical protein